MQKITRRFHSVTGKLIHAKSLICDVCSRRLSSITYNRITSAIYISAALCAVLVIGFYIYEAPDRKLSRNLQISDITMNALQAIQAGTRHDASSSERSLVQWAIETLTEHDVPIEISGDNVVLDGINIKNAVIKIDSNRIYLRNADIIDSILHVEADNIVIHKSNIISSLFIAELGSGAYALASWIVGSDFRINPWKKSDLIPIGLDFEFVPISERSQSAKNIMMFSENSIWANSSVDLRVLRYRAKGDIYYHSDFVFSLGLNKPENVGQIVQTAERCEAELAEYVKEMHAQANLVLTGEEIEDRGPRRVRSKLCSWFNESTLYGALISRSLAIGGHVQTLPPIIHAEYSGLQLGGSAETLCIPAPGAPDSFCDTIWPAAYRGYRNAINTSKGMLPWDFDGLKTP